VVDLQVVDYQFLQQMTHFQYFHFHLLQNLLVLQYLDLVLVKYLSHHQQMLLKKKLNYLRLNRVLCLLHIHKKFLQFLLLQL
tara:strand:- start:4 stop:249 length:246 start_codon:yes stop_codon:yes gene_type:complete